MIKEILTKFPRLWRASLLNFGIPLFLSAIALLLTMLMDDARIEPKTHLLFIVAVVISSWYGGLVPGFFATVLTSAGSAYFYHHIGQSPYPNNLSSVIHFVEFVLIALLITLLNAARIKEQARTNQARAEAETANRFKDEFLAAISHDLRTPLTSMRGWAHILRTQEVDKETAKHALAAIERGAEDQEKLIKDLLDISRIAAGKVQLEVDQINLAEIIRNAGDLVSQSANAKGIKFNINLDSTECPILGDSGRLQQVIWNLLSNAIKFTPQGGRVEVRLARSATEAEITVSDTGVGIDTKLLPYVFEPFRQGDGKLSHTGIGLGLAIVRHFVELHGGTVYAASGGEGCGSTFTVKLPLSREPSENFNQTAGARDLTLPETLIDATASHEGQS